MKTAWIRATRLAFGVLLAPFLVVAVRAADTDPAATQIQSFYDVLLDSMKHGKELGLQGRYEKLKPAIERTYNMPLMTSLVVGSGWSTLPSSDQQALIAAFERMTIANYAKNFDDYSGEKFTVDPTVQTRGVDKVVQTKLTTGSQAIPFNYRMRAANGEWKIVDVYLNGFVSELATKRSDFGSTLASGGASALVKKINALADDQMK
jgi:phospholipid transport system substrate-binding protein